MLWGIGWGLVGGIFVAIGGAFLDIAWEGFDPIKFLRSIWLGGFWGLIFSFYTTNASLIVFACIGMDRMALEFYKTFIRKLKSGKFKSGQPTNPKWLKKRVLLMYPYILPWLLFIFLLVAF